MVPDPLSGWVFEGFKRPIHLRDAMSAQVSGAYACLARMSDAAHKLCLCVCLHLLLCCCCVAAHQHNSYLSIVKQQEAATASSGQNALIFVISGVLVLAGSAIAHALGLGVYMTNLAAIHLTAGSLALGQILLAKARLRQLLLAVPAVGAGI